MTVAALIDVEEPDGLHAFDRGVVSVHRHGVGHSIARCSCGWTGRRRYLNAAARLDAWQHCIEEKCDVSVPLTVVGRRLTV